MKAIRISVLVKILLMSAYLITAQAQDSIGVKLIDSGSNQLSRKDFYSHFGYRNTTLTSNQHEFYFRLGHKGFKWNKWRLGAALGTGNILLSYTADIRLAHETFDKVHFYVESGISRNIDGYQVPTIAGGINIRDDVELYAGYMLRGESTKRNLYLGLGLNTDEWKKSLIFQCISAAALVYLVSVIY